MSPKISCLAVLLGVGVPSTKEPERRLREQPVRRRLLGLIRSKPGIHASELAREMDQAWGTVQYHLSLLRKADMVQALDAGRERRFFPPDVDNEKAQRIAVLQQGRRPEIAAFIQQNPGKRQVDICRSLGVSRKTFRSSVRSLVSAGLVEEQRTLHDNRYFAQDSLVDCFADMDLDYSLV